MGSMVAKVAATLAFSLVGAGMAAAPAVSSVVPGDGTIRVYEETFRTAFTPGSVESAAVDAGEFTAAYPDVFSGTSIAANGQFFTVGVARPQAAEVAQLNDLMAANGHDAAFMKAVPASRSRAELRSIMDAIGRKYSFGNHPELRGTSISSTYGGVVVEMLVPPEELAANPTVQAIAREFGDVVLFEAVSGEFVTH